MYVVPEKFSLSARKCGKGLKSKIEGKFEDCKFYFLRRFLMIRCFFSVFKQFSAFQIKFNSLLAGSFDHAPPKAKSACLQGETRINH